jgi:hypothetical protein
VVGPGTYRLRLVLFNTQAQVPVQFDDIAVSGQYTTCRCWCMWFVFGPSFSQRLDVRMQPRLLLSSRCAHAQQHCEVAQAVDVP